jgi:hypothetical protein
VGQEERQCATLQSARALAGFQDPPHDSPLYGAVVFDSFFLATGGTESMSLRHCHIFSQSAREALSGSNRLASSRRQ